LPSRRAETVLRPYNDTARFYRIRMNRRFMKIAVSLLLQPRNHFFHKFRQLGFGFGSCFDYFID